MQVGLFHSIQWPEGSSQQDRYDQALLQAAAPTRRASTPCG